MGIVLIVVGAEIEAVLLRDRGNRVGFCPLHVDGGLGLPLIARFA